MLLQGKTGLVLGVANKRSIAWGITRAADRAGAELILSYQNETLLKRVQPLAEELSRPPLLLPCDVGVDGHIDALFDSIRRERGHLDFVVHSLAFAKPEDLEAEFHDTSLEGFRTALEISAFSLPAVVRRALPLMEGRRGSVVTLTYLGGERVIPNYNVMGVAKAALESCVRYLAAELGPLGHRVNAVSAGPIKTLAAAGVSGFSQMLDIVAARAPMRRNVDQDEVGDATLFFLSDLSRAVTGEILFVDCGYHIMGL